MEGFAEPWSAPRQPFAGPPSDTPMDDLLEMKEESQVASPSGLNRTQKLHTAKDKVRFHPMRACYACRRRKIKVGALLALEFAPSCADW